MASVFFMRSVLRTISEGDLFKKVFGYILMLVGGLGAIAFIVTWFRFWGLVFRLGGFFTVVSGIIFQFLLLIAAYMVLHTIFIRARTILELPKADFTVIPIVTVLMRLAGEIYACFAVPVAVGGCLMLWLAGRDSYYFLNSAAPLFGELGSPGFIGGIVFFLTVLLSALLVLAIAYFLAETYLVLVDIARNMRRTRQIADQFDKGSGPV